MAERPNPRLDGNNPAAVARLAEALFCRPRNQKAYNAYLEEKNVIKGIKSGEVAKLKGMRNATFNRVRESLLADFGNDDPLSASAEDLSEAMEILDKYFCRKYKVNKKQLEDAMWWASDKARQFVSHNGVN